jgi:hypothetical protein
MQLLIQKRRYRNPYFSYVHAKDRVWSELVGFIRENICRR